jgi:outer membrane biogenesis lipoprotein LolB
MLRILTFALLVVALLTGCVAPAPSQPTTTTQTEPVVTVFKAPT